MQPKKATQPFVGFWMHYFFGKDDGEIQRLQLLPDFPPILKEFQEKIKILTEKHVNTILNNQKKKESKM